MFLFTDQVAALLKTSRVVKLALIENSDSADPPAVKAMTVGCLLLLLLLKKKLLLSKSCVLLRLVILSFDPELTPHIHSFIRLLKLSHIQGQSELWLSQMRSTDDSDAESSCESVGSESRPRHSAGSHGFGSPQ